VCVVIDLLHTLDVYEQISGPYGIIQGNLQR